MDNWIIIAIAAVVAVLIVILLLLIRMYRRRNLKITRFLMAILEKRDRNMDGHSTHTQLLIDEFYDYLPPEKKLHLSREHLRYAALLHDIGKLGVPEEILDKPGKLTDEEWKIMRRHPEIAVELLTPVGLFDPVLDWILYHHERMDGTGYFRLKGEEIPLASKMLAIVDTFSAVTVGKSYRPARPYEDGIATLRLVAGTQLDPDLVEIFSAIPKHRIENCRTELAKEMTHLTKKI